MTDEMKRGWVRKAAKMVVFGTAFVLLAAVVVMALWNALIPDIFGGAEITWLQALGLLVLARILTGRWGGGGGRGRRYGRWERDLESQACVQPEEAAAAGRS